MTGIVPNRYDKNGQRTRSAPSNLVPEKRMDANGRLVTRWVSDGSGTNASSGALAASAAMAGGAKAPVPLGQNWDTTSRANAEQIAKTVGMGAKDPDKLWDNIDFYTGLLESKHSDIALNSIANDKVTASIRDAWLAKHGATTSDRSYMDITGDEGYQAYRDAFSGLIEAAAGAEKRSREQEFEATLRGKGSTPDLNLSVDDNGRASVDVPFEQILDHKPTPGERAAAEKVAGRLRDDYEYPRTMRERIADSASEKIDSVLEATEVIGDDIAERHDWYGEAPEGVGGSTVAWSDFNPFKRRKK